MSALQGLGVAGARANRSQKGKEQTGGAGEREGAEERAEDREIEKGREGGRVRPYQQGPIDRLLAQVNKELFERHRLIVERDDKVAELRQEEIDLLVAKVPQLGAQHILDANMISIAGQVRYSERGVLVKVFRLDEALEQVPTHGDGRDGIEPNTRVCVEVCY